MPFPSGLNRSGIAVAKTIIFLVKKVKVYQNVLSKTFQNDHRLESN
jgi:hypothetical protein